MSTIWRKTRGEKLAMFAQQIMIPYGNPRERKRGKREEPAVADGSDAAPIPRREETWSLPETGRAVVASTAISVATRRFLPSGGPLRWNADFGKKRPMNNLVWHRSDFHLPLIEAEVVANCDHLARLPVDGLGVPR